MTSNEEDINYWGEFQQGDEAAYSALYRRHVQAMYRYGISLVSVSEVFVLDCIHDVFTEMWAKKARLSLPGNVRFYLLRSVKNRIVHQLQRQERPTIGLPQTDFDELWEEPSAEEIFLQKEETHDREVMVRRLIEQLPPRQQEALRLRFVEKFDFNEIAENMDINRQSAQNLVFRAIEKLRGWLSLVSLFFLKIFF